MTSETSLAPIGLVSVGVIAYNEEDRLRDVLADIVAQDFPHDRIEVLLVDSASTDGTKAVMELFAAGNSLPGYGFAYSRKRDSLNVR